MSTLLVTTLPYYTKVWEQCKLEKHHLMTWQSEVRFFPWRWYLQVFSVSLSLTKRSTDAIWAYNICVIYFCKPKASSTLLNKNFFKTNSSNQTFFFVPWQTCRRHKFGVTQHKTMIRGYFILIVSSPPHENYLPALHNDQFLQLFYMPEVAHASVNTFTHCASFTKLLATHITKHQTVGKLMKN